MLAGLLGLAGVLIIVGVVEQMCRNRLRTEHDRLLRRRMERALRGE